MTARWWVINGDAFMDALRRAHAGEDPDALYIEHYANSETEPDQPPADHGDGSGAGGREGGEGA